MTLPAAYSVLAWMPSAWQRLQSVQLGQGDVYSSVSVALPGPLTAGSKLILYLVMYPSNGGSQPVSSVRAGDGTGPQFTLRLNSADKATGICTVLADLDTPPGLAGTTTTVRVQPGSNSWGPVFMQEIAGLVPGSIPEISPVTVGRNDSGPIPVVTPSFTTGAAGWYLATWLGTYPEADLVPAAPAQLDPASANYYPDWGQLRVAFRDSAGGPENLSWSPSPSGYVWAAGAVAYPPEAQWVPATPQAWVGSAWVPARIWTGSSWVP